MAIRWRSYLRVRVRNTLLILAFPPPLTLAQPTPPHQDPIHFRDHTQVAAVACQLAAASRPLKMRTRCRVEAFAETSTEYIVRIRETPLAPKASLEFPRSEVRLQKDGTGAVLTRAPEL
jgi:hypothetical protein